MVPVDVETTFCLFLVAKPFRPVDDLRTLYTLKVRKSAQVHFIGNDVCALPDIVPCKV
jgi:hypothetical protein